LSVTGVFEKLRAALEVAGIPYFVTGSFASSAHGIPRSTNDIDIVIAPSPLQMESLLRQFPEADFAIDRDDAFDALSRKSLFNVVDYATMWKIDFIIRQPTPFDASRFARRGIVDIAVVMLYTASPEDILIIKLWRAKPGESDLQIKDAAGIIQVQGENLDLGYVTRWIATLDLDEQWLAARKRAG
jgi:hypothetical protein